MVMIVCDMIDNDEGVDELDLMLCFMNLFVVRLASFKFVNASSNAYVASFLEI